LKSGRNERSRPIQAAAQEAKHVYQLERAGESEWTPWIAIAALILSFAATGLLMFGIVEAASHLLASASSLGRLPRRLGTGPGSPDLVTS
jgi:hypothetical protein